MAAEQHFDFEIDFPKFMEKLLVDTEKLFHSRIILEAAEAHAEVIDQTICLIRSLKECSRLDSRDKENVDSVISAFIKVLGLLRRSIITPSTVTTDSIPLERESRGNRGRLCVNIPVEILEELQ